MRECQGTRTVFSCRRGPLELLAVVAAASILRERAPATGPLLPGRRRAHWTSGELKFLARISGRAGGRLRARVSLPSQDIIMRSIFEALSLFLGPLAARTRAVGCRRCVCTTPAPVKYKARSPHDARALASVVLACSSRGPKQIIHQIGLAADAQRLFLARKLARTNSKPIPPAKRAKQMSGAAQKWPAASSSQSRRRRRR